MNQQDEDDKQPPSEDSMYLVGYAFAAACGAAIGLAIGIAL